MSAQVIAGGRRQRAASWLDKRTAHIAAEVWVRAGLVRMAMRHRDRIPELAVMALEQDAKREPDRGALAAAWDCYFTEQPDEHYVTRPGQAEINRGAEMAAYDRLFAAEPDAGELDGALADVEARRAASPGAATPEPAPPAAREPEMEAGQ
jgi:hypothetical protein